VNGRRPFEGFAALSRLRVTAQPRKYQPYRLSDGWLDGKTGPDYQRDLSRGDL